MHGEWDYFSILKMETQTAVAPGLWFQQLDDVAYTMMFSCGSVTRAVQISIKYSMSLRPRDTDSLVQAGYVQMGFLDLSQYAPTHCPLRDSLVSSAVLEILQRACGSVPIPYVPDLIYEVWCKTRPFSGSDDFANISEAYYRKMRSRY
jgi:hypothetical protein